MDATVVIFLLGVALTANLPLSGKPRDPDSIRLYGQGPDEAARNPFVNHHLVGPNYFEVRGIGLRAGRGFTDADRPDGDPVAVVSRSLAERLWTGQDPIGRRFQFVDLPRDHWHTVVGVSQPVLHDALDGLPGLDIYLPYTQTRTNGPYYVVRTEGPPPALAQAAPAVIGQVDPDQSFLDVHTCDARIAAQMWQRQLAGWLFGAFAGLALLLAVVGLYGVLSQMVLQRTKDIGVRLALLLIVAALPCSVPARRATRAATRR